MFKKVMAVGVGMAAGVALLATATPAHAYVIGDSWSMVPSSGSFVDEISGSNRDLTLSGNYTVTSNGTHWDSSNAYGSVANSASQGPETRNFALGARFTIDEDSASGGAYTGKVIQFGHNTDPGRISMEILAVGTGSLRCSFTGDEGFEWAHSSLSGFEHGQEIKAYCYKQGDEYGIRVDDLSDEIEGYTETSFEPNGEIAIGSIDPGRNITVGNRGSGGGALDQHVGENLCSSYSHGSGSVNFVESVLDANC